MTNTDVDSRKGVVHRPGQVPGAEMDGAFSNAASGRRLRPALYSPAANRARKRSRPMRVTIAGAWRAPLARSPGHLC